MLAKRHLYIASMVSTIGHMAYRPSVDGTLLTSSIEGPDTRRRRQS